MAIENIKDLETAMKLEEGSLQAAIDSEESVKIEMQEGLVIRTSEEEETFQTNKYSELKEEFQVAGREIAIKDIAREKGYKLKDKTLESLLDAHSVSVLEKAKISPDKKVQELEGSLTTLRGTIGDKDEEIEGLKTAHKIEKQKTSINNTLHKNINSELTISKDDAVTIFNNRYTSEINDSGLLTFKKDGVLLKDKLESPRTVEDVMSEFLTPYAKKPTGGAEGGDETGSGKKGTKDAFDKEMIKDGHKIGSSHYNNEMMKRLANKTLAM